MSVLTFVTAMSLFGAGPACPPAACSPSYYNCVWYDCATGQWYSQIVPCSEQQPVQQRTAQKPVTKAESLYTRLGGEKAITAVVDDFVGRAAGNPKVNFTRKGTPQEWDASKENVAKLKKHLVQLIAMVTGGPQKYEGRDMKSSHAGMQITDAEFDALAGDLKATLEKFKVPAKEQQELLKIVGSTRGDIVEERSSE